MPFRRFFDRGAKRAEEPAAGTAAAETTEDEVLDEEPSEAEDGDLADPEDAPAVDWRARALAIIPGGASTGSKRPLAMHGSENADAPTHFVQASGCRVVDVHGNTYIDCAMALGAVALGYTEPEITRAVIAAAGGGNVSGLSDVREIELAERLHEIIPCAEQVMFTRTGGEGMAAAIRIARTYTGRSAVVGCGYFGWLDWSSSAAGVPAGVRGDYTEVPFNDVAALESAVSAAGNRLAAIAIEPVIERMPSEEWIARARALATERGAVLVFDEMKTGFRLRTAGYQELSGITPDLAVFGKAMANGYPLAAVAGHRDVMDAARQTWISSTLAGESTALAAALTVLDWYHKVEVCESLASIGKDMRDGVAAAVEASGIAGVSVQGIDPMWFLRFDDPAQETRFLELAAARGVLFKRGAYNYAALAHDDVALQEIEAAASAAFVELRDEGHGA